MPFPDVTKHDVTRNFEQVIGSILARIRPLLKVEDLVPDTDGWTAEDDLAALSEMVADSSDKLWSAAIDKDGHSRAGLLEERMKNAELDISRLGEQLSSLRVSGTRIPAAAAGLRRTNDDGSEKP